MISNKSVLALIPARGGSKGIKNKNVFPVDGNPLIAFTIEAAQNSRYIDEIVVSTDSLYIKAIAKDCGASVPFTRPKELAADTSPTLDTVLHAIQSLRDDDKTHDILVLLQVTSPLRTSSDIDGALEKFVRCGCKPLVCLSPVTESPVLMRKLVSETHMEKVLPVNSSIRQQDMPKLYRVNGSIYINLIKDINEHTSFNDNEIPYVIPRERALDIGDYSDLWLMRYYLQEDNKRSS